MEPKLKPTVVKIIEHSKDENESTKNKNASNINLCKRLTKIKSEIYEAIPMCIDMDLFAVALNACTKKLEKGCLTISCKIYSKENIEKFKKLLFVLSIDVKTDFINVCIIDNNDASPMILFTCSDVYPMNKIEKYLPTIVESTQTIINKM